MKLFLASQAKHPKSINALDSFVHGFEGKNIAYIPTAANAEEGYGIWKNGGSWNTVNSLGANVKPIVLEEFRSSKVISELEKSDIIWVGGGYWGYLMYWIRFCEIDKHIKDLLDSGIIYVGSSAGANIVSRSLEIAIWNHEGGERDGALFPGMGLVDFDIYPHYKEEYYDLVKHNYKGNKIYLLEDGEAIEVNDSEVKFIGVEKIIDATMKK